MYKVEKYAIYKNFICYRIAFDLKRLKKNYGNFIILFIAFLFILVMIINFFTNECFVKIFHKSIIIICKAIKLNI